MSEELTLHEAALRLYDYGPRIEMASTEEELIRLCDERDKLLSFFREADASRASPTPPTTEGREGMSAARRIVAKHNHRRAQQIAKSSGAKEPNATDSLIVARALLSSPRVEDVRREALEEAARVADDVQESEREEKRFDKEGGDYDPYSYSAGFSDGSITTSVNIGTAIRALLSSTRAGSGSRS